MRPLSWVVAGVREVRRALRAGQPAIAVDLADLVARETGLSRHELVVRAWGAMVGQPGLGRATR